MSLLLGAAKRRGSGMPLARLVGARRSLFCWRLHPDERRDCSSPWPEDPRSCPHRPADAPLQSTHRRGVRGLVSPVHSVPPDTPSGGDGPRRNRRLRVAPCRSGTRERIHTNQALSALLFLYREVLGRPFGRVDGIVHAKRPKRLPVVLTRDEIRALLSKLHGTSWLVTWLLYGTGLRLFECLELRVKDIDVERCQVVLRRGKGQKDRVTVLPSSGQPRIEEHLARVRHIHERDLARGLGSAPLPEAVGRKYPNAARDWRWQFVFPAARICRNLRWGPPCRFHLHESAIQRDVAEAVRASGISKHATVHTMRSVSA
jgi:integrase